MYKYHTVYTFNSDKMPFLAVAREGGSLPFRRALLLPVSSPFTQRAAKHCCKLADGRLKVAVGFDPQTPGVRLVVVRSGGWQQRMDQWVERREMACISLVDRVTRVGGGLRGEGAEGDCGIVRMNCWGRVSPRRLDGRSLVGNVKRVSGLCHTGGGWERENVTAVMVRVREGGGGISRLLDITRPLNGEPLGAPVSTVEGSSCLGLTCQRHPHTSRISNATVEESGACGVEVVRSS